jgi:hypothetical protein
VTVDYLTFREEERANLRYKRLEGLKNSKNITHFTKGNCPQHLKREVRYIIKVSNLSVELVLPLKQKRNT